MKSNTLEAIPIPVLKRDRVPIESGWSRLEVEKARVVPACRDREPLSPTTRIRGLCSRSQPKEVLGWLLIGAIILLLGSMGLGAIVDDTSEPDKRIQALIQELGSRTWNRATEELVQIGAPAVDPLLQALNGDSGWSSARASIPLSQIKSERAVNGLLQALDNPKLDNRTRRYILQSLGNIKSDSVQEALIQHLSHADLWIRCAAIRSLGKIGGTTAEDALISVLKDQERFVVESAIVVLGQMKSTRAPAHLIEILAEREGMGRIKITQALVAIGQASIPGLVSNMREDMNRETSWHLVWALGQIGSDTVVEPLVQALKSENWMVRHEAAVSLTRINSSRSVDPLRRLLKHGPAHSRRQARWILDKLESSQSGSAPASEVSPGSSIQLSPARDLTQITFENRSYALCPRRYNKRPPVPSPYTTGEGHDIVLTSTQDNKYILVPVTLENSERKGLQQYVNADDFPTLARTGFHSEPALNQTRTITGRSIAEITELARPDRLSTSGFLAEDEDIISVLKGDNRFARRLGLSHAQLAQPLFHALNLMDFNQKQKNRLSYEGHRAQYPPFLYNGKQISVKVEYTRGGQASIFNDGLDGALGIRIHRVLEPQEKDYLNRAYAHLSRRQRQDLVEKLSTLLIGEMVMYYIKWYGFYEGHTGWRADPIAIAFIFGLKDLADIDQAFNRKLYTALTEHFIREELEN